MKTVFSFVLVLIKRDHDVRGQHRFNIVPRLSFMIPCPQKMKRRKVKLVYMEGRHCIVQIVTDRWQEEAIIVKVRL